MKTLLLIASLFCFFSAKTQYNYSESSLGFGLSAGYSSKNTLVGEMYGGRQKGHMLYSLSLKAMSNSSDVDNPVIFESRVGYTLYSLTEIYAGIGYHAAGTDTYKSASSGFRHTIGIIQHFNNKPFIVSLGMSGNIYTLQIGIFGTR